MGLQLQDITLPAMYLWHGERDTNVPVAMGQAIANQLSQCTATYYRDEGHISVIVNHQEQIIMTLVS